MVVCVVLCEPVCLLTISPSTIDIQWHSVVELVGAIQLPWPITIEYLWTIMSYHLLLSLVAITMSCGNKFHTLNICHMKKYCHLSSSSITLGDSWLQVLKKRGGRRKLLFFFWLSLQHNHFIDFYHSYFYLKNPKCFSPDVPKQFTVPLQFSLIFS